MTRSKFSTLMGRDADDPDAIHTAMAFMTRMAKKYYPKQYAHKTNVSSGSFKTFIKDATRSTPAIMNQDESKQALEYSLRLAATDPAIFEASWNEDKQELRANRNDTHLWMASVNVFRELVPQETTRTR